MEIAAWLRSLGLERYEPAFRDHEIDCKVLPELTEPDLKDLGIPLGPRKKLLKAIAGSTELSARLDPEDMGRVIRAYHGACVEVVERWGGYVAKYLGDDVLSYFGWPQADEDDAERAVRAGLELAAATEDLKSEDDASLAGRIGIATGLVMVGEGAAKEQTVVGDTANLVARLQELVLFGALPEATAV